MLTPEKSRSAALVRMPINFTVFANCTLSWIIFASSGKCHPYHSRTLIAYVLSSLSKSSRSPMACTIMVSTCQDKVHIFKSQSEKRWHKKRKIFINESEPTTSRGYSSPCQGWISVCSGKDCERDQGSWARCLNLQGPQWARTTGIEDLA